MSQFDDAQAAEDAYYDAFDEHDIDAMMAVWADTDETVCLLPMLPAIKGRAAIRQAFEPLLGGDSQFEIQVKHLHWIEHGDLAIHLVEESINAPGMHNQSVYATNIYQKDGSGWRMTMHQNSPVPMPPPPEAV
ncbi:MAG: nuclear transport factor 2 family protein [Chromatiales bacterium]|jgi:uncharacterized protein (TIGR02246 family)